MQNPLQTTFHDIEHDENIESIIQKKFEKIKTEIPEITKCHVVFEKLSKHHKKANVACVRLDLKVSHFEDIVVTEKCLEDKTSLKSALIKVFKHGLELAHKHKKRLLDHKRIALDELPTIDSIESVD